MQLFAEVKRHKPSVIYLPGIDNWYHTLSEAVITTFIGLLKAIPPTDPVLVLGISDTPADKIDPDLLRDIFGFSRSNCIEIVRPTKVSVTIHYFYYLTLCSKNERTSSSQSLPMRGSDLKISRSRWIERRGSLTSCHWHLSHHLDHRPKRNLKSRRRRITTFSTF